MAFSDLAMKVAAEKSIEAMHAAMAPLKLFAHDYTELDGRKGEAIAVPVINLSASGEFDAESNNYCSGTQVFDGQIVTLDKHFVQSATITDRQLQATNFNWLGDLAGAQARQIGRDINKYVFGLFTDTNVTLSATLDVSSKEAVASLVKTAADNDINPADAIVVLGPADFYKVLSKLDANVYGGTSAIQNGMIEGLYGFYGVVQSTFLPSGTKGAIISRDAVGLASRYLEPLADAYVETWRASDGDMATVGFRYFGQPCSGARYLAAEALFGAKILLPNKIVRLV